MSVYVDPLRKCVPNTRWRWKHSCHLMADSVEELVTFGRRIGLKDEWLQDDEFHHYHLTSGKRLRALKYGATPLNKRQLAWAMVRLRNQRERLDVRPICVTCMEEAGDE